MARSGLSVVMPSANALVLCGRGVAMMRISNAWVQGARVEGAWVEGLRTHSISTHSDPSTQAASFCAETDHFGGTAASLKSPIGTV